MRKQAKVERGYTAPAVPFANDLEYLQEELAWIEARARRIGAEKLLAKVGQESPGPKRRHFRSADPENEDPELLEISRDRNGFKERNLRKGTDKRLEAGRRAGKPTSLCRLCGKYGLDGFERTILLLAVAPCISHGFEDIYEQLDAEQMHGGLTVEAAFCFMETPVPERVSRRRCFSRTAPLVSADLVTVDMSSRYTSPKDLLTTEINLTGRTFSYLVGDMSLADEFMEFSSVEEPMAQMSQVVLPGKDKDRILSVVEQHDKYLACRKAWGFDQVIRYGRGALMLFYGKPGTGKTMTAHAVAHSLGKRVLNVDIPTFVENREADRFLPGLFREARLQDAVLFFDECEAIFAGRQFGNSLMTLLLTELERFDGVAILATNLPQVLDEALDRRILVKVRFPDPDRQARLDIWRKHMPEAAPLADDVDLEALADRFEMSGGYIKNAILTALAAAVHQGGDTPQIRQAHLKEAARQQLCRPSEEEPDLVVPKARLADVILPQETTARIEELIDAARNRRTVLERWGIGAHLSYGKGISALLHGDPGTGKTLCAEAIAAELNRPLITAHIPAIVSKWVGQTERNLDNLFQRARAQQAVLFLDEADGLLTERGVGRASRHDDSAVNTLLTLIERHDGVVLLATNLPDRLDRALSRRLTYSLRFPMPDAAAREQIWRRLIPDTVPVAENLDFDALARRYGLSGGLIKNAVFKAAYRAARDGKLVEQRHLADAAREEVNASNGQERNEIGFASMRTA